MAWLPILLALSAVLILLLVVGALILWRQIRVGDVPVLKRYWQTSKPAMDADGGDCAEAPPVSGNGEQKQVHTAADEKEEPECDELATTAGSAVPLVVVSDVGALPGANGKGAGAASELDFVYPPNACYNNLDLTLTGQAQSASPATATSTPTSAASPTTQQPPPPPPHRPSSRTSRGSAASSEMDQLLTRFGAGGGISGTIDSRPGPLLSAIPLHARIATADLDEGDPV